MAVSINNNKQIMALGINNNKQIMALGINNNKQIMALGINNNKQIMALGINNNKQIMALGINNNKQIMALGINNNKQIMALGINNNKQIMALGINNNKQIMALGGFLSEALARLGGTVHGIDSAVNLIKVAKDHAQQESLTNLTYFATSIEDFAEQNSEKYDVVVASEIIEHVTEKELFLKACIKCLKPGGSFYITTFNRTTISWILGIWVIQEIFNIIPRGTHEWDLFISPEHLEELLVKNNCKVLETKGKFFNLVTRSWYWLESTSLMYAMHAVKL
ncbi:hypothetical protein FQA39_LY03335 [Lamprigera yunnana]|nr:hypothetical protein FQA39_LY03335 [Lamprigera yunnana]